MRISHVACGVPDLDDVERRLRVQLGLGLWRFPHQLGAHVPLADHQYVEVYGPQHPLWRPGWIAWSVAVERLDEWVVALDLTDARRFGDDATRTFTPWRGRLAGTSASRASGGVVPYLIEYDGSIDLDQVFAEKHRVASHEADVGPIARIETDGSSIVEIAVELGRTAVPISLL